MNYNEILKCYEGETEQHANTSFEFGLMNETYWCLFRDHDLLEYAVHRVPVKYVSHTTTHWVQSTL